MIHICVIMFSYFNCYLLILFDLIEFAENRNSKRISYCFHSHFGMNYFNVNFPIFYFISIYLFIFASFSMSCKFIIALILKKNVKECIKIK